MGVVFANRNYIETNMTETDVKTNDVLISIVQYTKPIFPKNQHKLICEECGEPRRVHIISLFRIVRLSRSRFLRHVCSFSLSKY